MLTLIAVMAALAPAAYAQRGGGRGAPAARAAARDAIAVDVTGYWVSVVTEDWKWRMVTPKKGVFDSLPLNAEGRRVGEAWDPAKDEAAGEQCRAYGAANVMRLPTRLHVTWQDANTLKIETDNGTQTRVFHFGNTAPPAEPSWQGYSLAEWQYAGGGGRGATSRVGGDLKVQTTHLKPGYLRKNGAPYSDKAVVTEYYDVNTLPNGDQFLTITTRVEDPQYLRGPYITTTDFKKLPTAAGWNPTPCSAK